MLYALYSETFDGIIRADFDLASRAVESKCVTVLNLAVRHKRSATFETKANETQRVVSLHDMKFNELRDSHMFLNVNCGIKF